MLTRSTGVKTISARDAAALVRSGDWLDYGAVLAQPDAFDRALAERVGDLHDVNIRGCLSVRPRAVLELRLPGGRGTTEPGGDAEGPAPGPPPGV